MLSVIPTSRFLVLFQSQGSFTYPDCRRQYPSLETALGLLACFPSPSYRVPVTVTLVLSERVSSYASPSAALHCTLRIFFWPPIKFRHCNRTLKCTRRCRWRSSVWKCEHALSVFFPGHCGAKGNCLMVGVAIVRNITGRAFLSFMINAEENDDGRADERQAEKALACEKWTCKLSPR